MGNGEGQNATDRRFFWLALYAQPGLWVGLAVFAVVRLEFVWLGLVGMFRVFSLLFSACVVLFLSGPSFPLCGLRERALNTSDQKLTKKKQPTAIALTLTITNTLAFSRCDKFSQASSLASSAMYSGGMARSLAGGVFSRVFGGRS